MPSTGFFPNPYEAEEQAIAQRRALAQGLVGQGFAPSPTSQKAGRFVVGQSPLEAIAKMLQAGVGGHGIASAGDATKALSDRKQADASSDLTRLTQIVATPSEGQTPQQALAASLANMKTPMGQQMAAQFGMTQATKHAERQALLKALGLDSAPSGGASTENPMVSGHPQSSVMAGGPQQPARSQISPHMIQALLASDPSGKSLTAAMMKGQEAHGSVQYDQSGRAYVVTKGGSAQYLPGITARDEMKMADTGSSLIPYNPFTQTQPISKGLTPEQSITAPLALGRYTFETGQQPPSLGAPQAIPAATPQQPRTVPAPVPQPAAAAPQPNDGLTPQAKAKLAAERAEKMPQARRSVELQFQDLDRIEAIANEIKKHPGLGRATGWAGALPSLPGGGAAQSEALIDSLRAQISGMKLQAMRNASPTGGAVGNVTEKEWPRLENMIVALDPIKMDKEVFKTKLGEVVTEIAKVKKTLGDTFATEYGQSIITSTTPLSAEDQQELARLRAKHGRQR